MMSPPLRHLLAAALLMGGWAGQATPARAQVPDTTRTLGEVVVTATRRDRIAFDVPRQVALVSAAALREAATVTTPDALRELPGVLIQKTNLGGGSAFLRGLTGKQVLLLVDGVRLNNSTYRYGPVQYLNTFDPFTLDQVEVVYGPGSVLYGSDALGGVVHLRTRPAPARTPLETRVYQRLASADRSLATHFDLGGHAGAFAWQAGGTYKHFGNLRAGNVGASPVGINARRQPFTGYNEGGLNAGAHYRLAPDHRLRTAWFFTRQAEVPISGRLISSDRLRQPDTQNAYNPQVLRLGYLAWEGTHLGPLRDLRAHVSVNEQREGRRRQPYGAVAVRYEHDRIRSLGASLQASQPLRARHVLTAGAEAYHDRIHSSAFTVTDGLATAGRGRFPDGTTYATFGVFLQDDWRVFDRLNALLGLRYSRFRVAADFKGLTVGNIGPLHEVTGTYADLTWSAETVFHAMPTLNVYASLARGFRAPNVDDLAVDGAWDSGFDVPNPHIEPEQSFQVEVGAKLQRPGGAAGLALFNTTYDDLIQRTWFAPGLDGLTQTSDDLYQFNNVAEAIIRGGEAHGHVVLGGGFSVAGQASYVWGANEDTREPLRRIPPAMGRLSLRHDAGHRWVEVFMQGARRQDRLSAGDRRDERIPEDGTPGWATLNVRGGYALARRVHLVVAFENVLDRRYRIHGSGLDAPGFNALIALAATR
jgi:outer membrane receptor protein involved in Fe transport